MANKNNVSPSAIGNLKLLLIVAVVLAVAWILGKGVLALLSSVRPV